MLPPNNSSKEGIVIKVYKKGRTGILKGKTADIKSKSFTWLDATNPSKTEIENIAKTANITVPDLKAYYSRAEHPTTFEFANYSLIVFSAVSEKTNKTTPLTLFISDNRTILTLHRENIAALKRFEQLAKENTGLIFQSPTKFVFFLLDELIKDYFDSIEKVGDEITAIENKIFHKKPGDVHEIFKIKKSLIYFHKALMANREVITGIEKEYVKQLSKRELKLFRDQYNDIVQLIDLEETYREILTGVLDTHLSVSSHNLNKAMKTLTVITAFVMIPTLISGVYGMNFQFMPELAWKYGYAWSFGLMALSVVLLYIFFKKNHWL